VENRLRPATSRRKYLYSAVRVAAFVAFGTVALWTLVRLIATSLERQVIWTDFALFHATVNRWLDGQPMYASGLRMFGAPRFTESVNFNPPQFHLLVLPLARVDLWPALLMWQLASLVAGCVSAAIVIRTLRPGWSPLVICVTAALILNSAALSSTLWFGQMSLFLSVPVTLAWRALRQGRWNAVGAWLGLAGSIKPLLFIVVPYLLLKRQWKACLWCGATWAASFAIGVAVFGPAAVQQWLDAGRWPTWLDNFHNASFQAYVARLWWEWPGPQVATLGSAIGVAATVWLARNRDADAAWAILMAGALLWAPLGWVYYEWFLFPPLAALLAQGRIPYAVWPLAIAFVWPITGRDVRITGTFLDGQIQSIYFWGLLGVLLTLCSSTIRPPADAHRGSDESRAPEPRAPTPAYLRSYFFM
jgi:alpha-1,2-mannosyltransferase